MAPKKIASKQSAKLALPKAKAGNNNIEAPSCNEASFAGRLTKMIGKLNYIKDKAVRVSADEKKEIQSMEVCPTL